MSNRAITIDSNGRVLREAYLRATWQSTDGYLEIMQKDERIQINYQNPEDRRFFNVTTTSGTVGWMNGNDIEYTHN